MSDRDKCEVLIRRADEFVREFEEFGFGKTSDKAWPGWYDAFLIALREAKASKDRTVNSISA